MELFFLVPVYFIFINIVGILLMYSDKKRAIKGKWRIKEKTLFSIALLGGSVGILLGGKIFRHKTLHHTFKYGIPAIIILQFILLIFVTFFFKYA